MALAAVLLDVFADDGQWSDHRLSPTLNWNPPNHTPGVIVGSSVRDVVAGQIHFPPVLIADPSNPIFVWGATWTAIDFTPRDVRFSTMSRRFDVYCRLYPNCGVSLSRLAGLVEDSAHLSVSVGCYPDCDTTTGPGVLDIFDFLCFGDAFSKGCP